METFDKKVKNVFENLRDNFNDDVIDMLNKPTNKESAEFHARKFYKDKYNKEINIHWVKTPNELTEMFEGKEITTFPKYYNINWIWTFNKMYEGLSDENVVKQYTNTYRSANSLYSLFCEVFAVAEVGNINTDKVPVVVLVESPKKVSIVGGKLHSLNGPAFYYDDEIKGYYIDGVKFDEETWASVVKTSKSDEITAEGLSYVNELELLSGSEINEMSLDTLLNIKNTEVRSKALTFVGYDLIQGSADIKDTKIIATHKGKEVTYELLEMDLGLEHDGIPSRFVKVDCWSTGNPYVLMVDPRSDQCESALGAVAWTFKKPNGDRCTVSDYLDMEYQT